MQQIEIFSPATVANVSCGFDALGFALDTLGDTMVFKKTLDKKVTIKKIVGADLTYDVKKNVAGVVAEAMLKDAKADFGLDIEINKNFKPGSGLGSSAASAAGTAFALNQLMAKPYSLLELTKFAMLGEEAACGSLIADNVGAAIYGGFILVRSYKPLELIKLPVPEQLIATLIHPQIEVKTQDARNIIKREVSLNKAIIQWANVGGLVSGLYTDDYGLIGRSLEDVIVEPYRKKLIPFFEELKQSALKNGALGAGISGSGPSIFALSRGLKNAQNVAEAMRETYQKTGIPFEIYVSKINKQGIKIL